MNPAPTSGNHTLEGVRVVLLRGADQAVRTAGELHSRGAAVQLLPLIDFETPDDSELFDAALKGLASGAFSWLVVTSSTTVRALKQQLARRGLGLSSAVPSGTRIAAVGEATAGALFAEGLRADLVPDRTGHESSAAGLAAAFRGLTPEGRILLPQADIAADTLERLLVGQGWDLVQVTAYRTVAYPADPSRRITASVGASRAVRDDETGASGRGASGSRPELPELDPAGFWAAVTAGAIDAVVFTSPSTVRRLSEQTPFSPIEGFPAGLAAVMIGASTAAEARRCGIPIAAVAADPTPAGIADAIAAAMQEHTDREKLKAREEEHP
ncbi:uroporphyrinogen-III synthase [Arthrobacter flavus]|uniref:Uroporphyrinogen-III synthase n=1 Tax=Arthrobacter flavus TaxID=95172 RepID=A0ABW4QB29_9MICC